MSLLPEEHPDILEYLRSGGFSVQMNEENPFGRIPVDQTCEETVNKKLKRQEEPKVSVQGLMQ